jgi:succinate dehydrogenase / fumarate reductase cytochrome b subunit
MDGTEQKKVEASPLVTFLSSTIGKKQIVAVSGLLLCGFLVGHLLGNLLLFAGPDSFNIYAHRLTSTPLIYVAEAVLSLIFLGHLFLAMNLTYHNKMARPEKYFKKTKTGKGANFFSRSMPYTGLIILIFLVTHLMHFKYGAYYSTVVEGQEIRDVYRTVMEYFAVPSNSFWYVFAMLALSAHLYHGVQSTFQSLGFNSEKWNCTFRLIGKSFGLVVPLGFLLLTLWCYFQQSH